MQEWEAFVQAKILVCEIFMRQLRKKGGGFFSDIYFGPFLYGIYII